MRRIFLTIAALVLTASASFAGPVCDRMAANRAARVEARRVAYASCPCYGTPVRNAAHVAAVRVVQVAQAQPVRTAVAGFVQSFSTCPGGVCPR